MLHQPERRGRSLLSSSAELVTTGSGTDAGGAKGFQHAARHRQIDVAGFRGPQYRTSHTPGSERGVAFLAADGFGVLLGAKLGDHWRNILLPVAEASL